MRVKRADGSYIVCEQVVEIGDAVFYLNYVKFFPTTQEAPAEGGYFEIVDYDGYVNDNDLPDLENECNRRIEEDADYYLDHSCG